MKTRTHSLPAFLILWAASTCAAPAPQAPASQASGRSIAERFPCFCIGGEDDRDGVGDTEIRLVRTWGMGDQPNYSIRLRGDGKGEYRGFANVRTKGRVAFHATAEQVLSILDGFESVDFMNIEHYDSYGVSDLSAEVTTLTIGKRTKEFSNKWRKEMNLAEDEQEFHASLAQLTRKIDETLDVKQWTGRD